jgi:plasmid stabilization system protein ParE
MKVKFLRLAQAELDDAIHFYESEQNGLGARFRGEVFSSISRIIEFPAAYPIFGKRTRRCLTAKFPYGIIYHYDSVEEEVLIIALAHLHRQPEYWVSRES